MAEHVHKMTRLHIGPPKTYYCETPMCDYEVPADQVERVEGDGRLVIKDAPALVTTTVAAAAGELLPTPARVSVMLGEQVHETAAPAAHKEARDGRRKREEPAARLGGQERERDDSDF